MMETMVAGDLWEQALQRIQSNLPSQTYDTWFRSLGPLEFDGSTLVLEAPSQFYVDWLDQHYRPLIESSVAAAADRSVGVAFHVRAGRAMVEEDRQRGPAPSRDESNLSASDRCGSARAARAEDRVHLRRNRDLFLHGDGGDGKREVGRDAEVDVDVFLGLR